MVGVQYEWGAQWMRCGIFFLLLQVPMSPLIADDRGFKQPSLVSWMRSQIVMFDFSGGGGGLTAERASQLRHRGWICSIYICLSFQFRTEWIFFRIFHISLNGMRRQKKLSQSFTTGSQATLQKSLMHKTSNLHRDFRKMWVYYLMFVKTWHI